MADDPALALDESVRPPLENGEVVFDTPWQSRVFGIAVALSEAGVFAWPQMQAALIREVGAWDAENPVDSEDDSPGQRYRYWDLFSNALIVVLADGQRLDKAKLAALAEELAARPRGHDHHH